MKLSQMIERAQVLLENLGDVDVLDNEDFNIENLEFEKAHEGQLKFWGMDPNQEYFFVRITSDGR